METVFVGNLSYFCSNSSLTDFFAPLGPVQGVNVRRSKKNVPLHYGFVEMPQDLAMRACNDLNGVEFMGRRIRISIRKGISEDASPQSMFHSLHLSFLTTTVSEQINEIYLTKIFGGFGGLEDCVVKSHMFSKRHNKQGGYAFLYFRDLQSAENILHILQQNNGSLDGVMYDAKFSCTSLMVGVDNDEDTQARNSLDASTDSEVSHTSSSALYPDIANHQQHKTQQRIKHVVLSPSHNASKPYNLYLPAQFHNHPNYVPNNSPPMVAQQNTSPMQGYPQQPQLLSPAYFAQPLLQQQPSPQQSSQQSSLQPMNMMPVSMMPHPNSYFYPAMAPHAQPAPMYYATNAPYPLYMSHPSLMTFAPSY